MCSNALGGDAGDVSRPDEVELAGATTPDWQETTVYASAGNRNEDKGSLFLVKVYRSSPSCRYMKIDDQQERLVEIVPQDGMPLNTDKLTPASVPDKVQDILNLKDDGSAFVEYKKSNTGYFDYSASNSRDYGTFFFEDAGDAFIIQRQQGKEAPALKVKHGFQNIHIHRCALDARNGRIPVVYSCTPRGLFIGLVSVETGELTELGPWKDYGLGGCLKWLNDRQIVFTDHTRYYTWWGVYDVQDRKILHEYDYNYRKEPDEQEWSDFCLMKYSCEYVRNVFLRAILFEFCLIKDGCLYVTTRNEEKNRTELLLFPVGK